MHTNYIYRIRRKSDNKFYFYPRPSQINRQIRRGRPLDYWCTEAKAKKFRSLEEAQDYIANEITLHRETLEIVPFEIVISYVECDPIAIDDAQKQPNLISYLTQ